MLRSSEIKPLFVDLSLCDKSLFFVFIQVAAYERVPKKYFFVFLICMKCVGYGGVYFSVKFPTLPNAFAYIIIRSPTRNMLYAVYVL